MFRLWISRDVHNIVSKYDL